MLAKMNGIRQRAFSLIELMLVVALTGILLSLAVPSLLDILNSRRVEAVAAEVSTDLAYARAEAGLRPTDVVVNFGRNSSMSCYSILIDAVAYNCDCTREQGSVCKFGRREIKTTQIPTRVGVDVAATTPTGSWVGSNPNDLTFDSPRMTTRPGNVHVVVKGVRGGQLQVRVNAMGRIITCTPDGSMSGVAPC
jgi:type IV fimbrial biogenesis protein FimT